MERCEVVGPFSTTSYSNLFSCQSTTNISHLFSKYVYSRAHCGNFRIFSVIQIKSENLEVLKLLFLLFLGLHKVQKILEELNFRVSKYIKMADFELLESQKMISRKI